MSFATMTYLVFLLVSVTLYWALPHKYRWVLLLITGYIFYGSWKWEYVLLLVSCTMIAYVFASNIARSDEKKTKKTYLISGIMSLCVLLGYFKYTDFLLETIAYAYELLLNQSHDWMIHVILPVGISFYIFQCISYMIDVYRDPNKHERHLGYFAVYVSFFPQLVAGPIERSTDMLPQLKQSKKIMADDWYVGWKQILWGLFKKLVVADQAGILVDQVFVTSESASGLMLLGATYLFAFQIYADFSGYCDIAIGSGRLFGIKLSKNFNQPYLATSIVDFWRRWHITLMSWFRDYIYIPLGGNRAHHIRNIVFVFLVSGIWHGAAWTFIIWGILHGCVVVNEHKMRQRGINLKLSVPMRRFLTFQVVCLFWIVFRAGSIGEAGMILAKIFSPWNIGWHNFSMDLPLLTIVCTGIVLMLLGEWWRNAHPEWDIKKLFFRWSLLYVFIVAIIIFGRYGESPFIYFQF